MINYYPINEELARRAQEMNSYFDYKAGSATAEYRRSVDEAARIAEEQKRKVDPIHHVSFLDSIPLWAITLLGSLFIWVLSLVMILTVYSRFFKLFMATAIAPIPFASFAGQPSSSIGIAFLKTYAAICMEGCVIVLACVIFSAFASAPPALSDPSLAAATIVWNYVGEILFNMLVLVGAIKMSDRLIRELMGLG